MATACVSDWRTEDQAELSLDPADPGEWTDAGSELDQSALRARAALILAREIRYVENRQPDAHRPLPAVLDGASPLLSSDDEVALFRAMNHHKRQALQLRKRLSLCRPNIQLMDDIQSLLASADAIRNRLVTTFLGLGFSIARQFATLEYPFDELSSEANMTLLLAVERYDCDRGFRFSTYATHAVRRNLVRYLTRRRKEKLTAVATENLDSVSDLRKWTWKYERQVTAAVERLDGMLGRLDPRDAFILRSRCGLAHGCEVQSLQSLADALGISRERVRQLEQRATLRLRGMAKRHELDSQLCG